MPLRQRPRCGSLLGRTGNHVHLGGSRNDCVHVDASGGGRESPVVSLIDEATTTHERFEITRNGRRAAVLLSADDYDTLQDTIAVLADAELLSAHHQGQRSTPATTSTQTSSPTPCASRAAYRGERTLPAAYRPAGGQSPAEFLPEKVAAAAYEFITGPLLDDPHRVGQPLDPPMAPAWTARRGTYRILYLLDDTPLVVEVTAVRHRSDAYQT